jgi:hypothetical protein
MGALLVRKEGFLERIQIGLGQVAATLQVTLMILEDNRFSDGVKLIGGEIFE